MLVGNGSQAFQCRVNLLGGQASGFGLAANSRNAFGINTRPLARFVGGLNAKAAIPDGYNQSWILPALKPGGMSVRLYGSSTVVFDIAPVANMVANPSGLGTLTANLAAGRNLSATILGTGTLSTAMYAPANIAATVRIGAQPTAFDIAQAVWQQSLAAFNTSGSAGKQAKDALTRNQFMGLK